MGAINAEEIVWFLPSPSGMKVCDCVECQTIGLSQWKRLLLFAREIDRCILISQDLNVSTVDEPKNELIEMQSKMKQKFHWNAATHSPIHWYPLECIALMNMWICVDAIIIHIGSCIMHRWMDRYTQRSTSICKQFNISIYIYPIHDYIWIYKSRYI